MRERIALSLVVFAVAAATVVGPVALVWHRDAGFATAVVREAKPTKRDVRAAPERPTPRPRTT